MHADANDVLNLQSFNHNKNKIPCQH